MEIMEKAIAMKIPHMISRPLEKTPYLMKIKITGRNSMTNNWHCTLINVNMTIKDIFFQCSLKRIFNNVFMLNTLVK
ncbi:MAG: hypothetical protein IJH63_04710 [Methanobrevibacter sp.]|nr:hypothetical protein [Methanobrevibacter sp.]